MAKFCVNCGKPLNENDKVCGTCGSPVLTNETAPMVDPNRPKNITGNKKKAAAIGAVLLVIVAFFIVIIKAVSGTSSEPKVIPVDDTPSSSSIQQTISSSSAVDVKSTPVVSEKSDDNDNNLNVWDGSVAESFDGGDGSMDNPFQIANGAQLAKLNDGPDYEETYFVLTDDIYLNDISEWDYNDLKSNMDAKWTSEWITWDALGRQTAFAGNFDGDGHTIYGIYDNKNSEQMRSCYGLFGRIEGADISNVNISCSIMNPCAAYVGGIVGYARVNGFKEFTIKHCQVNDTLISSNLYILNGNNCFNEDDEYGMNWVNLDSGIVGDYQAIRVGGICGYSQYFGEIEDCVVDGAISYNLQKHGNRNLSVGGIVGENRCHIIGCENNCDIIVNANLESKLISHSYPISISAGGICGRTTTQISSSVNKGDIEVTSKDQVSSLAYAPEVWIGGIVGSLEKGCIGLSNCHNEGKTVYDGDVDAVLSTVTGDIDTSADFDQILCNGGNFIIVSKMEESVSGVTEYVGVIDNNYKWIHELSDKTTLNPDGKMANITVGTHDYDERCEDISYRLHHCGNGIFIFIDTFGNWHTYNALTDTWTEIGEYEANSTTFHDGYLLLMDVDFYSGTKDTVLTLDTKGNIGKTGVECTSTKNLGEYSEGKFFAYDGFYDIEGNKVIDLTEYAGRITNWPYFFDGQCILTAKNENGTEYKGVIDSTGKFISEFAEVN